MCVHTGSVYRRRGVCEVALSMSGETPVISVQMVCGLRARWWDAGAWERGAMAEGYRKQQKQVHSRSISGAHQEHNRSTSGAQQKLLGAA